MPDFGIQKKAYRPLWQETPGYKTVVDQNSQLGIYPAQTESNSNDRGQSNLDSMWPVELPQSHEKQRALPLPSNHDQKREKRIGPTVYNKPRKVPDRTLSVPGEQYGHPTKYDYNYVRRRQDVTALADTEDVEDDLQETLAQLLEMYGSNPSEEEDESLDLVAGIFPSEHQKGQSNVGRLRSKKWYQRHPKKKRDEKLEYRLRKKRLPREKLKRKYRRMYKNRYKRRGLDPRTPAQKTKEWREENKREENKPEETKPEEIRRQAGMNLLSEVLEILGFDVGAGDWPVNWGTQVKNTVPPDQLDQNFGKEQGTPRSDPTKQEGESLRAPNLLSKPQRGLGLGPEMSSPSSGGGPGYSEVTTLNPTDGSGKVIPMSYYTDIVNNTQTLPDSRQDRYLRNNNEVKQGHQRVAMTVSELLERCDKKIKERAKKRPPKLSRIDTKNWIWHWKSGKYTVRVQAFKRGNAKNFPKLNLRISCSCPFWRWWGPEHWGTKADYQRGELQGTGAYPKVRDPAHWKPVCKHAYAVLEKSKSFFVRPGKSPLKKLSSRFSVNSTHEIEIESVEEYLAARVAQRYMERQTIRRVACGYLGREDF